MITVSAYIRNHSGILVLKAGSVRLGAGKPLTGKVIAIRGGSTGNPQVMKVVKGAPHAPTAIMAHGPGGQLLRVVPAARYATNTV